MLPEDALGFIETRGLAGTMEAADTVVKGAPANLVGKEKVGSGFVPVMMRDDVGAVKAASEAGGGRR